MPVWTAGDAAGAGRADGTKSRPVIATSGGSVTPVAADATIDATRARSAPTSPCPSGCTRFDRKMTQTPVSGSTQIDVPVNPV